MYNGQYGVATDDNGLYYMRARYYNVDIKRFINQDVVVGGIDRTSSLNRYSYVEGNPVSYLDPFGLDRWIYQNIHNGIDKIQRTINEFSLLGTQFGMDGKVASSFLLQGSSIFAKAPYGVVITASSAFFSAIDFGMCISEAWYLTFNGSFEEIDQCYARMFEDGFNVVIGGLILYLDVYYTKGMLGFIWGIYQEYDSVYGLN